MGYIIKYVVARLLLFLILLAAGMMIKAKFFPSGIPREVTKRDAIEFIENKTNQSLILKNHE